MGGLYYFNCNGPARVGPYGNYNEALQDCEMSFGGPCQFLGCDLPPCGAPAEIKADPNWKPDAAFLKAAKSRKAVRKTGR
jgi:hypothetical protein